MTGTSLITLLLIALYGCGCIKNTNAFLVANIIFAKDKILPKNIMVRPYNHNGDSNQHVSISGKERQSTALGMVQSRGLEIREEGATPLPGGMTLYLKAGPDGSSIGDCPFAHYVRMILHEKGLEYDVRPCTKETKPDWLIDYYDGSVPALRHRKECYTESDVIAQYLDFFFQEPSLSGNRKDTTIASECLDGFFQNVVKYLKHTPDGDDEDEQLKAKLEQALAKIEARLLEGSEGDSRVGPFLVGNGEKITLLDCSLSPKLFHLKIGLQTFKNNSIDIPNQFPSLQKYMDTIFSRDSFEQSSYAEEVVVWGWSNAREN
eukprot:CAMPEP_0197837618 /NCGR_PEP_ID=MMETSP1437-20131217/32712_1 /TAXON_ID=49252 ORGANISM="Eucampia antarctica, Strain CCMP1452" /NCGR_SAMPLE_ID=MMETSP1437 /ASSEMBLY_ACC=CAM_ASM_001096 /LENGTH=318 /DNA_ID=CAMNT_0043444801 /DNA_START=152 /DNA_END=1108 /DNA_ORIENTATION=+